MTSDRIGELLDRHFEGALDDDGRRELQALLATSPEVRRRLAREARERTDLSFALGRRHTPTPMARTVRFPWTAAAGLLVALSLLLVLKEHGPSHRGTLKDLQLKEVARLAYDRPLIASAGTRVRLERGEIEFAASSLFSIDGAKDSEGRRIVTLTAGHARLRSSASAFLIRTPAGSLRDIGTTFEVQLNPPMDEEEIVKRFTAGRLAATVTACVLSGLVQFETRGTIRRITPEMGRIALSADTAVARVKDREGSARVKPAMADRWSLAEENMRLEPGDMVRTGTRGANTLKILLSSGIQIILGPDAQMELTDLENVKLHRGEVEVSCPEKTSLQVAGPAQKSMKVSGTKILRARDFSEIPTPGWLRGYKSDASTEACGSLLANVDGRNVPLEIGYHKVIVDIRDQIARTEIEESFVNTTNSVLEGVFYFPLPQDASISGFGMWIGDQYVHADVVEKERAREIYETILREKRDPGLLEWGGGNVFKARVYPIGAEKRIRITYTQVLPKVGGECRYFYPLMSEMLKLHPLKKLKIEVKVSSSEPIASISSPSHTCRTEQTEHAGHLEFETEEYAPDRDFEARIAVKADAPPVTFLPHRRGDDGYFLMLLTVPGSGETRDLVEGSERLDFLVVADTSGSMYGAPRRNQIAFVEALLSSLSEKDRINLMTCDVEARWAFSEIRPNTGKNREEALTFLEKRVPLGWSNLDLAFASAMDHAARGGHVVYVGDGVPTSGDADPAAFGKRLEGAFAERGGKGTFHAVAPGSTYESGVLSAIASLGGGSQRTIGDPAQAAHQLLKEIAAPGLKGAKVSFEGLNAAAVYPETLPNLPAGAQQVILGRYDAKQGKAAGKAFVRGDLNGKPTTFDVALALPQADAGNSFIPRLWARAHLDFLLRQGTSQEIREKIVTLSEDYQIITPYTSFLVLESDADRERFGVKKRFQIRDGEEFFAQGRSDADFELSRKAMLAAARWRKQLRAQILKTFAGMGRDLMESLAAQPEADDVSISLGLAVNHVSGGKFNVEGDLPVSVEPISDRDFDAEKGGEEPSFEPDAKTEDEGVEELAKEPEEKARWEIGAYDKVGRGYYGKRPGSRPYYSDPLGSLFPQVPGPRRAMREPAWPKEILDLLRTLDRRAVILKLKGGIRIVVSNDVRDERWKIASTTSTEYVVGPSGWTTNWNPVPGQDFTLQWVSGDERGILTGAWLLGSTRPKKPGEESSFDLPFEWNWAAYDAWTPTLRKLEDGKFELSLSSPQENPTVLVFTIDPTRRTIVEVRSADSEGRSTATLYEDWVEVGGAWWPRKITTKNDEGSHVSTATVAEVDAATEIAKRLERKKDAILLGRAPKDLVQAKQAAKDGKATIEDLWALLRDAASRQDWDRAKPHFEAFCKAVEGKIGRTTVHLVYLRASRRNEELKSLLRTAAGELAGRERPADYQAAWSLLNEAGNLAGGSERLEIVRLLKPVFERRTQIAGALLQWERQVLAAIDAMNRWEDAFAKRRELADRYSQDADAQVAYAQAWAQRGEVDAALAFLSKREKENGPWKEHEVQALRAAAGEILLGAHRLQDYLAHVDAWAKEAPKSINDHQLDRYLSVLLMLDREEEHEKLVRAWLQAGRPAGLELRRFEAAIRHAVGNGYNVYARRLEPERIRFLADLARNLLTHETLADRASTILHDGRMRHSDEAIAILREVFERLSTQTEKLPLREISRLYGAVYGYHSPQDGHAGWNHIHEALYRRWESAARGWERSQIEGLLGSRASIEIRLKMRRAILAQASDPVSRREAASALFHLILSDAWSAEREKEAVELLSNLVVAVDDPEDVSAVRAFHGLAEWITAKRADATVRALPNVNEMTRRQEKAAREQALAEARRASAALLSRLTIQELQPWIAVERFFQQAKLKQETSAIRAQAEAELRALLKANDARDRRDILRQDQVLATRLVLTLLQLAVIDETAAKPVEALLREMDNPANAILDGKDLLQNLLLALDRGDDLEAQLKSWYGDGGTFEALRWGRVYAYVLAERNRVDDAVKVMESVGRADTLDFQDYRTLADWYQARADKAAHREARIRSWERLSEWQVQSILNREWSKYSRTGPDVPSELDEEVPIRFAALFRKAQDPGRFLWLLSNFYKATRDFRLLEALADGTVGQSSQRIYSLLTHVRGLLNELQEEATLERLSKRLNELHARATEVDRRALRLLEFMAECRAAEMSHGTGPHVEAALRAMREAFRGTWAEGEPEKMAAFLGGIGSLQDAVLAKERLEQLRALLRVVPEGSSSHLAIAVHLADVLRPAGADVLRGTLDGVRRSHGGTLPVWAIYNLGTLSNHCEVAGAWSAAEGTWTEESKRNYDLEHARWLRLQLHSFYGRAFHAKADVSVGSGETLYRFMVKALLSDLEQRTNESHMIQLLQVLATDFDEAHRQGIAAAKKELSEFAFQSLPRILGMYQYRQGQQAVSSLSQAIERVCGATNAVEFLVARAETEPRWLRLGGMDFWPQLSWQFSEALKRARPLRGSLDERALAVVLRELRADLRRRGHGYRVVYAKNYGDHFWSEKEDVFSKEAREALEEQRASEAGILHVVRYLYDGLRRYDEAIEALLAAEKRGVLAFDGRYQLCRWLHERNRARESLAFLPGLLELRPDQVDVHTMFMVAWHHRGDAKKVQEVYAAAEKRFREKNLWKEWTVAAFAVACLDSDFRDQAVVLWKEAIALHVKSARNRGVGDGTLARYYMYLSRILSRMGRTDEAVDAAAGAIVSWGPRDTQRNEALAQLQSVLSDARDLDAYVTRLDVEVKKSGMESPILRKALGKVYQGRGRFEAAAAQFKAAIEAQTNDLETHRLLVQTYDGMDRRDLATAQLLETARLNSHDPAIWRELGERWKKLEQPEEAERAWTNMVEGMPHETEGHQAYAGILESQGRWAEAETPWRHVARIRSKEPAGWLGLAEVLIRLEKWREAREVVDRLLRSDWPSRFEKVRERAAELDRRIRK